MMADLTEFLLARIREDASAAQMDRAVEHSSHWDTPEGAWLPTRVLAECEARRRIVRFWADPSGQWSAVQADAARAQKEYTLRALALPYAAHPDYDPAWAF